MAHQMTTARGSRGSAVKPGEVESFSIMRADNGFTAQIRTKQKPHKGRGFPDYEAGNELEVFNQLSDLIARVQQAFGDAKLEKAA
jgi:hypothetical protein